MGALNGYGDVLLAHTGRVLVILRASATRDICLKGNGGMAVNFSEDITASAESYEQEKMLPAATNTQTADELVPHLLTFAPKSLRPAATEMISVMMPERLRKF